MSPASVSFPNFSKPVNITPAITKSAQNTNTEDKKSLGAKVATGVGLACLAASGVYIATGRTQNVGKVFEKVKNADSIMDVLKNAKLSKGKFKELMFKITGEDEVAEKFITEVTADPRKSKEHASLLKKKLVERKNY